MPDDNDLVCYCFNISRADIKRDIQEKGKTGIPDRIRAEIKASRHPMK